MTTGVIYLFCYLFIILITVKPLGTYMAWVYQGKVKPLERAFYKICNITPDEEMDWKRYVIAILIFNAMGFVVLYGIQRLQLFLPLNPQGFAGVSPDLALNTASSFVTNTNWQAYSGETTMSYFTQMFALTVQNFLSAATGMALLVALIRGIARHETTQLGNCWVDMTRSVLYILLPLSLIFAVFLTSQGVIQNFKSYQHATLIQPTTVTEQILPMGPVASQVAIKQLGTNGGGFFNVNSAHPFENPTPLSNFLEMLAMLLIPAALCYTFGVMVNNRRQGWALLATMLIIFIPCALLTMQAEIKPNPAFSILNIDSSSGNMEGKEVRFGAVSSALWATATTASSNGSVNAMHDSFSPTGGLIPLWLMHLGEVVFGGVGSGLYGMLMVVITTVFIAGLMIGRTPEFLGKKIEPFEMKMVALAILVMPLIVLIATACAVLTPLGTASTANPGAHGFSEILYAFTSMGNNNGSAFAGLNANTPFYNIVGSIVILMGRYWIAIPVLAIAGSLARKKIIPASSGTLPTHTPLFIFLLIAIIGILGALSFLPALALGPIVEQLSVWGQYGH